MKKSLLALALIFELVGALNAQDILALVTKGALSDNSKGVKVLSLDEMKQVKGGYISQNTRAVPALIGYGYYLGAYFISYANAPKPKDPMYSGRPNKLPHIGGLYKNQTKPSRVVERPLRGLGL